MTLFETDAAIDDIKEQLDSISFINPEDADAIKEKLNDLLDTAETEAQKIVDDANEKIKDLKEQIDELDEKQKYALPVVSIIDACKVPVLQRMFQNLNLEQLEEVEKFAKSMLKHPAKYIDFIHEN